MAKYDSRDKKVMLWWKKVAARLGVAKLMRNWYLERIRGARYRIWNCDTGSTVKTDSMDMTVF